VTPPSVVLRDLLDPRRLPREGAAGSRSDAEVVDLLPPATGTAGRSRRAYSARPFDHHAPADDPSAFERGLSPLARRLPDLLPRDGVVLEAGSGAGHMTAWLASRGVTVVPVDQSVDSLRRLRERVPAPAVAADVTALPFQDAAFDAVLADGVVHHTGRPRAALSELVRVLRPDGLLFVRIYRAEGLYPSIYRTIGGLLRACEATPPLDALVWRLAFPAYRAAADRRHRRRGAEPGRHDEGVFSDYFLTPRATPMRGAAILAALRRLGLEALDYEAYRNVHGFVARKRGGRAA
jgi:SAM-dependent methyltransferase